eukprot:11357075-Heterocapsa_arctica.AAC.1
MAQCGCGFARSCARVAARPRCFQHEARSALIMAGRGGPRGTAYAVEDLTQALDPESGPQGDWHAR